jgi:hypothetical protein
MIDSDRDVSRYLPDATGLALEELAQLDTHLLDAAIVGLLLNKGDPSAPSCASVTSRLWQNYIPEPQV